MTRSTEGRPRASCSSTMKDWFYERQRRCSAARRTGTDGEQLPRLTSLLNLFNLPRGDLTNIGQMSYDK
jgi:hypothetical protein